MYSKALIILSVLSAASVTSAFSPSPSSSSSSSNTSSRRNFLDKVIGSSTAAVLIGTTTCTTLPSPASAGSGSDLTVGGNIVFGDNDIMAPKAHGTSETAVQENLRYGVSNKLSDKICNYNRHFAEYSGSFLKTTFEDEVIAAKGQPITFYDSVSGKPLFVAPIGRSVDEFLSESEYHGWPSFRDQEVVWENVRVLKDGETVSVTGTHLGHNIPSKDRRNRYCINLVSVAGNPAVL